MLVLVAGTGGPQRDGGSTWGGGLWGFWGMRERREEGGGREDGRWVMGMLSHALTGMLFPSPLYIASSPHIYPYLYCTHTAVHTRIFPLPPPIHTLPFLTHLTLPSASGPQARQATIPNPLPLPDRATDRTRSASAAAASHPCLVRGWVIAGTRGTYCTVDEMGLYCAGVGDGMGGWEVVGGSWSRM